MPETCKCDGASYYTPEANALRRPFLITKGCPIHDAPPPPPAGSGPPAGLDVEAVLDAVAWTDDRGVRVLNVSSAAAALAPWVAQQRAEAYDEAIAHACEMFGAPNVNWQNPYRADRIAPTTERTEP